jgi:RNA recognition motif-containing protein
MPTPLSINSSYSLSFSWSLPSLSPVSHAHARTLSVKAKRVSNFVLHFSSTAQEQALDSSSANVSAESQELEPEAEGLSRSRLIAQNVPWTCTAEDIRALFEEHGTVLDVEVFSLFWAIYYLFSQMGYGFCVFIWSGFVVFWWWFSFLCMTRTEIGVWRLSLWVRL